MKKKEKVTAMVSACKALEYVSAGYRGLQGMDLVSEICAKSAGYDFAVRFGEYPTAWVAEKDQKGNAHYLINRGSLFGDSFNYETIIVNVNSYNEETHEVEARRHFGRILNGAGYSDTEYAKLKVYNLDECYDIKTIIEVAKDARLI